MPLSAAPLVGQEQVPSCGWGQATSSLSNLNLFDPPLPDVNTSFWTFQTSIYHRSAFFLLFLTSFWTLKSLVLTPSRLLTRFETHFEHLIRESPTTTCKPPFTEPWLVSQQQQQQQTARLQKSLVGIACEIEQGPGECSHDILQGCCYIPALLGTSSASKALAEPPVRWRTDKRLLWLRPIASRETTSTPEISALLR